MRGLSDHKSLDDKDVAILRALAADGRTAFAELGRKIGLSQPAMSERVKRLEDRGVISGYSVRIDWELLGIGLGAVIRLATDHSNVHACMEKLRSMRGVLEILRVTGEDCLFIRLALQNAKELECVVDSIARFGLVRTSVILSEETHVMAPLESQVDAVPHEAAPRVRPENIRT